jgi:hypothetical protein
MPPPSPAEIRSLQEQALSSKVLVGHALNLETKLFASSRWILLRRFAHGIDLSYVFEKLEDLSVLRRAHCNSETHLKQGMGERRNRLILSHANEQA